MQDVAPIVLTAGVAACVALFWWRPGPDAVLICLIGGWAVLPTGSYPESAFLEPAGSGGSMHAVAIPTSLLVNKATSLALGCLAGAMLFDWPAIRRVRPGWVDLPILAWCLVPVASALANGLRPTEGLAQARYLVLAWGVPYFMGRVYLTNGDTLQRLALGWVLAGMFYVPLCLVECIHRPFLYGWIYGAHPYQLVGAERFLGYRPLVFLEDGNQLGMWMASAAVSAVWLWRAGRVRSMAGVLAGVVAIGLVATSLLIQSHAAIALMLTAVIPLLIMERRSTLGTGPSRTWVTATIILGMIAGMAMIGFARQAVDPGLRHSIRETFAAVGKTSFTWRMARYEELFPRIAQRPILGWSRPDWSASADQTFVNPIGNGLWLLILGMYGLIGLVASTAVLVLPIFHVFRRVPWWSGRRSSGSAVLLTAVLLAINLVDSLMNSGWLLPLLAGAGGLNSWSARGGEANSTSESSAWKFDRTTGLFQWNAGV